MYFENQGFEGHPRFGFHKMSHGCGHRPGGGWGRRFAGQFFGLTPVNVKETPDQYELHVYAPGLTKEDFKVRISDDTLVISYQASGQPNSNQWVRAEYYQQSFERRFELNDKIDSTGISARYQDGVLIVALPKKPGAQGSAQEIGVA